MFFYLSQFLSFLVMPLTIVIFLLLSGMAFYKTGLGKKLLWLGMALLLFFSNQYLANYAMYLWEPQFKVIGDLPEYELGIVLTGVTNLNKTAYDRTFFNKGADRATHAMQLYKLGKIKKILITGGQGLNPTNTNAEADLLAGFMVIAGVSKEDIIIENKAVNTRENALFTKDKLEELGFNFNSESLLITSAFHMKRSKGCFDKVEIPTVTFPVDYYASDPQLTFKSLIQPSPDALQNWHILVKEWVGLLAYKLSGHI
jgi:uncharacterized SAM-binding protein YcdF (DUF218 family)